MMLCDTDWLIDVFNGRDDAIRYIAPMIGNGLAVSVISVGEMYDGILHGRKDPIIEERRFLAFLSDLIVLRLDVEDVRIYAALRERLGRIGRPIGDNDLYIAATALRHGLTLVTRNRRHFDRIDRLRIHDAG